MTKDEGEAQREQLQQLLYAVCRKHPNETRFETALRYINEAENRNCVVLGASKPKDKK